MSDIVERLYRAAYDENVGPLCNEAAAEIERLQVEVKYWRERSLQSADMLHRALEEK